MKTTITINLNNLLFYIEEDAYDVLKTYLQNIEKHFKSSVESKEIINDIESRIAELLKERLGKTREVINVNDINEIIKILGNPDDIGGGQSYNGTQSNESNSYYKTNKRLFRNPDNRVLGGVCGGMGAFFNIDPIIPRLIFLLAFFGAGIGFLIYIILWIVVPEAKTTAEKYQMRGEPFNLSNIGKNIKDEFNHVKNKMNL